MNISQALRDRRRVFLLGRRRLGRILVLQHEAVHVANLAQLTPLNYRLADRVEVNFYVADERREIRPPLLRVGGSQILARSWLSWDRLTWNRWRNGSPRILFW